MPFGSVKVFESYVPFDQYMDALETENFAILLLERIISRETGYLGLHVVDQYERELIVKAKVLNVGYLPSSISKPPDEEMTKMDDEKTAIIGNAAHELERYQQWGIQSQQWSVLNERSNEKMITDEKKSTGVENQNNKEDNASSVENAMQSGSGVFYFDEETDAFYIIGMYSPKINEDQIVRRVNFITSELYQNIQG